MQAALGDSLDRARTLERIRRVVARDDLAAARPLAEELAAARPEDLAVEFLRAWIRSRLEGASPTELEGLARRTLAAHASLGLPLCALGHAALQRGDDDSAERFFRRAAEVDPSLLDAKRGALVASMRLRSRGRSRRAAQLSRAKRWIFAAGAAVTAVLAHAG